MQIKPVISSHSPTGARIVPLTLQRSPEQSRGSTPPPSSFRAGESFKISLQLHLSSPFFCLLNLWINNCFLWLTRHMLHNVSGPPVYEREGARAFAVPPCSLSQGWLMMLTTHLCRYSQSFSSRIVLLGDCRVTAVKNKIASKDRKAFSK